jgi:hypothetical protein
MNVSVTNQGEEVYIGRFNGREYEFPVGEPVLVPQIVAQFLFAYGMTDADRVRVLVRNGWHTTSDVEDPFGPVAAKERLESFVFKKAPDAPARKKPEPKVLEKSVVTSPEKERAAGQQSAA